MECCRPITLFSKSIDQMFKFGRTYQVPCGKCPACIDRKRNEWIFRIKNEMKNSFNAYFITLTYAPDYLPLNSFNYPTFNKRDVQLFLKNIRYVVSRHDKSIKVRHFFVGEYGSINGRPHYHGIIWNIPLDIDMWRITCKYWIFGRISVAPVNGKRIGYVCNYMYGKSDYPEYDLDESNKIPFLCSTKPGIGYNYCLNAQLINYHKEHLSDPFGRIDGKNYSLPRYYIDKLFNEKEKRLISILKRHHVKQAQEERFKLEDEYRNRNPDLNLPGWYSQHVAKYYSEFYKRIKKHKKSNNEHI